MYFSTSQVSRFLGVHPDTVLSYIKQGLMKCGITPPGPKGVIRRKFTAQNVLDFMDKYLYAEDAINAVRQAANLPPARWPAPGDPVQLQLSISRSYTGTGLNQLILVAGNEAEEYLLLAFYKNLKHVIGTQDANKLCAAFGDHIRDNQEKCETT